MITEKYVFNFGKYKGKNILQVIKIEAGYILWCSRNISKFKEIDSKILKECEEIAMPEMEDDPFLGDGIYY